MSNLGPNDRSSVTDTVHPDGSETRTVRAAPSRTGYWIAGAVAVVAIIAVAFMVVSHNQASQTADPNANQAALTNAYQQGQAQAQVQDSNQVAAAQAAVNQAAQNQATQAQAMQNQAAATQAALAQSTDAANRATARAQRAADRVADQTPPPPPSTDSSPQ
jgi:hypothetical protein